MCAYTLLYLLKQLRYRINLGVQGQIMEYDDVMPVMKYYALQDKTKYAI